jgi:uncharacterized protein
MSATTLENTFAWVFASGLVRAPFTLLWHAGEPLVVSRAFYEQAIALLERYNRLPVAIHHALQTNATLIDDAWCRFFLAHEIFPGVSVDGPAFLHDRHRRTRQGKGTFDRVLRGIRLLRDHDVPFYVISVLTAESLLYPDELFDFYQEQQIPTVAFNVEEIEGPHTTSSLLGVEMRQRFRRFFSRFMDLALAADPPLAVREFDTSACALRGPRFGPGSRTQENKPWAIVNVDCEGNFSTYSPELLGISSASHGSFALGHVERDSLESVIAREKFQELEEEIRQGVERCQQTCSYFAFCGGGAPANKFFEKGTFAATETLFCRLHKQVCLDVTLERLEGVGGHLEAAVEPRGSCPARGKWPETDFGAPLIVAPFFHLDVDWAARLSLGISAGQTAAGAGPSATWRPATAAELSLLVRDPMEPLTREELPGCCCVFAVPVHLRSAFCNLLAAAQENGRICPDDFDVFAGEVARFLAFKQLTLPVGAAVELAVNLPGQTVVLAAPSLWGLINLGEDAAAVVLENGPGGHAATCADGPVRIHTEAGEGIRLPAGRPVGSVRLGGDESQVWLLIQRPAGTPLEHTPTGLAACPDAEE